MQKHLQLPTEGHRADQLLERMSALRQQDTRWQEGRVWSLVYYAGPDTSRLVKDAFNLYFSENGLNPTAFPSLRKYETEVVAMTASMLGGDEEVVGTMTSGGTESILMSVKTAREYARKHLPQITAPEMVLPVSAHPAFQKSAHYFDIKPVVVDVGENYRADPVEIEKAITPNTILLVGSAPSYPHGVVDPIEAIGQIALDHNLLFHVDCCIGGFMLPFLKKLGHPIPNFDFQVPGVTSISADVHKYGYAAKGASVILYRNSEIRRHQFFVYTEWPGGIYGSPAVSGTRSGGSIAAAWAVMQHLGEAGYLKLAEAAMHTTKYLQKGINAIEDLYILGEPDMTIFAFGANRLDIYAIGDEMTLKGWHIDRQQFPACLHLTVNFAHVEIADQFLQDLEEAVGKVSKAGFRSLGTKVIKGLARTATRVLPKSLVSRLTMLSSSVATSSIGTGKRSAAMYGMMGELPNRGDLHELVLDFMDKINTEPDLELQEEASEMKHLK